MKDSELNKIIHSSEVVIHKGRYSYLKTKTVPIGQYFLIAKDNDEITVVAEESDISKIQHEKEVKWFKLIEIKVSKPFLGVGFLAKITKTIADKGLNVLVVSTFSKDYILVREETYQLAIESLKKIGFPIKEKK